MEGKEDLKCIIITDESLKVLDQLLLPNTIKYLDILTIQDAWSSIKEMNVRGAPLISVVALQGLKIELLRNKEVHNDSEKLIDFLVKNSDYLKTSRPTAVNLANDLNDLINEIKSIQEKDAKIIFEKILELIQKNFTDYENSSIAIAKNGADLILKKFADRQNINILTICNTGKLAMPGVGTALGIIREIHNRGKLKTLYIPETRPYNQGSRLTAFEAMQDNLPGVLISDSMVGMLMNNKMVDCVIVGADRVTKYGATANKIGTYTFSVVAKHHGIPFYVACPVSTIDFNMKYGREIHIEERPADEIRKVQGIYLSPKDIKVWNPSFDVTPPTNIESIITEQGYYEFDKSCQEWEELAKKDIENYLKKKKLLNENEEVVVKDIADGNLNNVFCVQNENKAFCVKQALPYIKCVGTSWPMTLKRAMFEAEALKYENSVCPEYTPKLISFDDELALTTMEFLKDHIILRNGLIQGKKYFNLAEATANFTARTTFFSSHLHLEPELLRKKMSFWNDNSLCKLTEQVVFSDPYVTSHYNRWTSPYLDEALQNIKTNKKLIVEVAKLRHKFITGKQALIHADLHSGSIMLDDNVSIKVIDGEFSFYGPIGYDSGNLIAHLIMSCYSQKLYRNDEKYEDWILSEIVNYWDIFEKEFLALWTKKENRHEEFPGLYDSNPEIFEAIRESYMKELFRDTLGYAATEIIRRIVGIAHIQDFENCTDLKNRSEREKLALNFAVRVLTSIDEIKSIKCLVDIVKSDLI
jgi:5-methylthioribose kinase